MCTEMKRLKLNPPPPPAFLWLHDERAPHRPVIATPLSSGTELHAIIFSKTGSRRLCVFGVGRSVRVLSFSLAYTSCAKDSTSGNREGKPATGQQPVPQTHCGTVKTQYARTRFDTLNGPPEPTIRPHQLGASQSRSGLFYFFIKTSQGP